MLKTGKKILCALLVVVMCLTSAPLDGFVGIKWLELPKVNIGELFSSRANAITELAATGQCGDNVYWDYDSSTGKLVISGSGDMTDYSTYSKSPFYNVTSIRTITIESGVTSIGSSSFSEACSVKNVELSDTVTVIGNYAFSSCTSLESIIIPDSVTSMGNGAFSSCTSLTSIIIPDSVTSIGDSAFSGCTNLTSIIIPDSVISIGEYAFSRCTNLTSIIIPDGVKTISNDVFSGCTKLENITIPDSVTSIGYSVFWNTAYYNNYNNWENDVLYIGKYVIDAKDSLSGDYTIKDGILMIASSAFYNCTRLENITIPNSVTSIGNGAFSWCTSLTSVIIPDSVKIISDGAFSGCTNLENITIPDSVTSIGHTAFERCTSLTSIIIPDSVKIISDGAFSGCTNLENITIPESIISIGYTVFDGTAYYDNSDNWENSILYIGKHLITAEASISGDHTIKNSTLSIAKSAFKSCSSLISIKIPDSVTHIGESAFFNCTNLTNITIPDSITSIEPYTFKFCYNLTKIIIPDSVKSIGNDAFYSCTRLLNVYYAGAEAQWKEINIGLSNENLTNATIYYNYKEPTSEFKTGDIIQFGSYPQTEVKDEVLLAELNALAPAWDNWISYGYYSGNGNYGSMKQGDWMRYVDIKHDGNKYRGVKFTQYRPYHTYYNSSTSNTYQDDNGYNADTAYWFKFESIDWRVLDPNTGLIMCDTIIDSQPYSNTIYSNGSGTYSYFNDALYKNYASDYETSSIRRWLNEDFYNTAFSYGEKKEISVTTLNNDGYYTLNGTTGYEKLDSNETKDKIFLLSYKEVRNSNYGFNSSSSNLDYDPAKLAKGSDYAQSQGLYVYSTYAGYWLLRSPGYRSSSCCSIIKNVDSDYRCSVVNAFFGIRPALRCNLSKIEIEDDNTSDFTGEISGVLTAWDGLGFPPKAYIDDIGYKVADDDILCETLSDNLFKKVICEVKDGVIITCKTANFEGENSNFYFEKSNYTFYVGENHDADWRGIYLNYHADQHTIDNFDDSIVSVTVSNPEIIRFNGVSTDNTSEKDTAIIECFIVALKPGVTTLTAKMPNGLKSVCTITVLQSNQIVMNIENTETHYQANRFFFDKNGEYSSDAIEMDFKLQNIKVEDCYYLGDDDEINDNLILNNVKVVFKLKDNAFALSRAGADEYTVTYDNIKFNELKEDILRVYCIDKNASNSYLGRQLKIEVYVYFDDPVTGENIEQGKDVVEFTVQSYEAKYVKEHAEALGVDEDYHDYFVNCFSENMIGLEDEFEFFWWKTMSKSFADNAISLFTDFNEVNGYEIVIADILSILTSEDYNKQSEMFGNAFFDFCCSVYETLLDVLGETYINKLYSEISGKTKEYTLGTVVAVMSGDVTKGPAFEAFDKLLKNNKVVEAMDNATFIGGMINKVLVTYNIMKDTISGMQKAAVIWSAYDAYKEIITSNDEVLIQLKDAAKAKENESLVKALENYLDFNDEKMWQKAADGIAATVVNGGGSAIQLGLQSLSKTVFGNFENKILHVFGSVASGLLSGFELGRLLSDSLCNAGDYAEASCAVVSVGYISVALKDVILDLLLELGKSLGDEIDYSKAQKLDFALKMFKAVETLAYNKTIDGLNARGSSTIGGYLSKDKKEEQSRVIADLLAKKASLEKIECHDTNLSELYSKICSDFYTKEDSGNLSDVLYFTSYKTLCIQCPVDVFITNSKGEVVAQIINNEIVSQIEGIGIVVYEDEKYICVPDTDEYNIIITATDAGKMDYTVFEYNKNGDNIREVEYSNISLYNGQTFTGKVDKLNLAKSDNYNLTTDSKTIYADKDEYVLSEGHKYTASIIKATCTENGKRVYTCTCGDTYTETIISSGHSIGGWYDVIPASCENNGMVQRNCSVCDYYETQQVLATGHNFAEGQSKCNNCDYNKADMCSCKCHKTGFLAKLIWKITIFFNKLLRRNKVCSCGIYHY